ncbi:hypothetical protein M409DRAFT_53420 [Zasmidium cellare ATCC 36951]|uniref:Secreted protein CSS2 C-terminal domain-containing protein n=1 Tax=Zasmidium cellare ATCC 36951 TaxID=1080233 RepID=A0A6A6CN85_ZASCE|nr:uncharacterized protein M409DRAFT_53420 [Zasmidium cellare ATCC 36951]KAF2168103.1 hypothetical protein M409DRAFT_53420 [Zasmidium cellare ATCC 36951]
MQLSLLAFAATSFALPSSSSTNSRLTETNSPDRWAHYDLTRPFNSTALNETGPLEKRRQIGVCEAIVTASSCVVLINTAGNGWLVDFVNNVGNLMYDRAHSDFACNVETGAYRELQFKFQAYGGDCSTTAQRDTIKGGIENHLKTVDGGKICATECLKLDHGGSCAGYLLVGPVKSFDSTKYCGPDLDFSGCSSGGQAAFG